MRTKTKADQKARLKGLYKETGIIECKIALLIRKRQFLDSEIVRIEHKLRLRNYKEPNISKEGGYDKMGEEI